MTHQILKDGEPRDGLGYFLASVTYGLVGGFG
jgi:hypothetical protein